MALTQVQFLGASVIQFNSTLGLNGGTSSCNVTVIEDYSNGDFFNPPLVGNPVYFVYETFKFSGILTSYERSDSPSANPIYEITINDPTEILQGTQLILSNYNGNIENIPNLINVYGYLESVQYGYSGLNSGGIQWGKIKYALNKIFTNQYPQYGSLLRYKGINYNFDRQFSTLDNYRLNGPSISLLNLVQELTQSSGQDFFTTLNGSVISINTISRLAEAGVGNIAKFIKQTEGAKSKKVGYEVRRGYTGKFLIGSDVERLYIQEYQSNPGGSSSVDYTDDTIWPYWGKDHLGNVIVGRGDGKLHTVTLDSRHIDVPGVGETYEANVEEFMAAFHGQASWESFLSMNDGYEFIPTYNGWSSKAISGNGIGYYKYYHPTFGIQPVVTQEYAKIYDATRNAEIAANGYTNIPELTNKRWPNHNIASLAERLSATSGGAQPFVTYKHNNIKNIHYLKAERLGLISNSNAMIVALMADKDVTNADINAASPLTWFSPFTSSQVKFAGGEKSSLEERKKEVFEFIASYAQEYMAKKYMVRVPFVFAASNEEETGEIGSVKTSQEPIQSAFVEESLLKDGLERGILPADFSKFLDSSLKFKAYVKFNNISTVDTSLLSEQDYCLGKSVGGRYSQAGLFVKCDVEPELVFLDKETGFSPRAVITLPAAIVEKLNFGASQTNKVVFDIVYNIQNSKTGASSINAGQTLNLPNYAAGLVQKVGGDGTQIASTNPYRLPDLVAVPLKSKIDTYGPYYSRGADSQVEFEHDDTLNPWTYGGFELMDVAGQVRVNDAIVNQTFDEYGSVEVPGVPTVNMGSRLIANGPYVTDIRVNVGSEITTTYSMRTWNRKNSNSRVIEDIRRLSKAIQLEKKKRIADANKAPSFGNQYYQKRKNAFVPRNTSSSSHTVLIGQANSKNQFTVCTEPPYDAVKHINDDYYNTAVISFDGIFSPISTNPGYTGLLPRLVGHTSQIGESLYPNSNTLNPYPVISDGNSKIGTQIISYGDEPPIDMASSASIYRSGDYRTMALRGPLLLHGWGFDTIGNPVPGEEKLYEADVLNSSGEVIHASGTFEKHQFASGYRENPSSWPVGPVDLRWDEDNGVWTNGSVLKHGLVTNGIPAPDTFGSVSEFYFTEWSLEKSGISQSDNNIKALNLDPSLQIVSGVPVFIITTIINSNWVPIWVGCG